MKDIDLVKRAKHIIENGGLLARDTALTLIEKLEAAQRAEATLTYLGYTDNGGQFWKPPVGPRPDFSLLDAKQTEIDALREKLEAAQRERDALLSSQEHEDNCLIDAMASRAKWHLRAKTAEAEIKRRDEQKPDGHIFCHPDGKLFWSVTHDSNAGRNGVRPYYFAAPAAVPENYISLVGREQNDLLNDLQWTKKESGND